jgi:uncharacterized membrane protein
MDSRTKLFGHPIHPMLIVFPVGLLIAAVAFDAIGLTTGTASWHLIAYWNIAGGLALGLLAAVFGLIDWIAIPSNTRAKRVGLLHGAGNVVVVALFGMNWILRSDAFGYAPSLMAFGLSIAGLLLLAVTGWLGGELVDRLGVGVDDGAHLDAPSSLTRGSGRLTPGGPGL